VKQRTVVNIVLLVLIVAAGGFLAYRKFRKHDVVLNVGATSCKGPLEVEYMVVEDDEVMEKDLQRLGNDEEYPKAGWKTPTLRYRAGAMFTVLARGQCKTLTCGIHFDGQLAGQGGAKDKDQVSCTAMLGN